MRIRKENGRISSLVWGETLEIYLSFDRLKFEYCTSFYFDQRHMLNTSLTTLIGIVGLLCTHLSWWSLIWVLCLIVPWGKIFLHFPWKSSREEDCDWPAYGFYLYSNYPQWYRFDSISFEWGMKRKSFDMPWDWTHFRSSAMRKDGTWEHSLKGDRKSFYEDKWNDILLYETHDYKYTLKSGKIQEVEARCRVEQREWRWKALMWLKWPAKINTDVSIEFSGEVGERAGEWKGGTIGCSYPMLPGDTIEMVICRMERERKFN